MSTFDKVKEVIIDKLGVEGDAINSDAHFVNDLGADSLDTVELIMELEEEFGIDHGFLTTLHPWLGYQNLLDGPSASYSSPGEIHDHYALGRSSFGTIIPKTTSAVDAANKVLSSIDGKFLSFSYRVPTMIVGSADASIKLKKDTSSNEIKDLFIEEQKKQTHKVFYNNNKNLISSDFIKSEYSAIIDHRWLMINNKNYLKIVLWYDNEWGYSARVVDLIKYMGEKS